MCVCDEEKKRERECKRKKERLSKRIGARESVHLRRLYCAAQERT